MDGWVFVFNKNSVLTSLLFLVSQEYIIRVQRGVSTENSWQVNAPITTSGVSFTIHNSGCLAEILTDEIVPVGSLDQ